MKKTVIPILLAIEIMAIAISCNKEVYCEQEGDKCTDSSTCATEITVDDALNTLGAFLESEGLSTKASLLLQGKFSVEKWTVKEGTKASSFDSGAVYCIDFSGDNGSAVLAADIRMSEKIYCVTESKLGSEELTAADAKLNGENSISSSEQPELGLEEVGNLPISDAGETFAAEMVYRKINSDIQIAQNYADGRDEDSVGYSNVSSGSSAGNNQTGSASNSDPNVEKVGPLLRTKWRQETPFNDKMGGVVAGCGPVAAAQVIYYFKDKVHKIPGGQDWDWGLLENVCPYTDPENYNRLTPEQRNNAANFMLEVKYNCNMKTDKDTGCIVDDIKRCLKNFGFVNPCHDWALSGGSSHDIRHINSNIEYMIRRGKPVIMLSGSRSENGKLEGHVFVLDGYKRDSTGEYLHINWGWTGTNDGYYSVGCFDVAYRHDYDSTYDSGAADTSMGNFNYMHYYVYYDI